MSKRAPEFAPDFTLLDTLDRSIHLAEIYQRQPVLLVLTRGFT